jgi:CubicO group peptidase (beta-lactamase class C family)
MKLRFSNLIMRLSVLVILFCLLCGLTTWADALPVVKPEEVGLSSQRLARIGAKLKAGVEEEGRIPGVVALVARQGKIAYFESFGKRVKASGAPMKKDSIFRIYSMSKPIVSVAAMILIEEGRFSLRDLVSKYIPELGKLEVGVEGGNSNIADQTAFHTEPAKRDMTIYDLLRHTSGLAYSVFFKSVVKKKYQEAGIRDTDQTLAEMTEKLGKLPLAYQPGTRWEYSRSTDVLGRLLEVVSGMPLDRFLEERIFIPLKMKDTGFYVKSNKLDRLAEPAEGMLLDVTIPPKLLSGGGGLVSTVSDYIRFAQMLLNGGALEGTQLLSRKTVEYMTSDHLGPLANRDDREYFPGPGYGFGLGVAVRLQQGMAGNLGSVGDFWWAGYGGTFFWVDPQEKLIGIIMFQNPAQLGHYTSLFKNLVMQSIVD